MPLPSLGRVAAKRLPVPQRTDRAFFLRFDQESKKAAQQVVVVSVILDPALAPRRNPGQVIPGLLAPLLQRGRSPDFLVRFALVYYCFHFCRNFAWNCRAPVLGCYCKIRAAKLPLIPA